MTKETLISWIEENGHSNEWLAEKCGVKLPTINSWRSNRPIPGKAELIIKSLMFTDNKSTQNKENTLNIKLSDPELDLIEKAANIVQTPLRQYMISAIIIKARQDTENSLHIPLAAEPETPYNSNIIDPATEQNENGGESKQNKA